MSRKPFIKTFFIIFIVGNIVWSGGLLMRSVEQPTSQGVSILLNQVGYFPSDNDKIIMLQIKAPSGNYPDRIPVTINLVLPNGQVDHNISILNATFYKLGDLWGNLYYQANISALRISGNYSAHIDLPKKVDSYPFSISSMLLNTPIDLATYFFYYQRCGCQVLDIYKNYTGHPACHLDDANSAIDHDNVDSWLNLTGGWHDAGDYNKYNGYTILSVYTLADIFENNPSFFSTPKREDTIPNSTDCSTQMSNVPDVLEESIWGADFLVKCILPNMSIIGKVGSNNFVGWYGYSGVPNMETDNLNSTPTDNRQYFDQCTDPFLVSAALAKLSYLLQENHWYLPRAATYAEKAIQFYQHYYDTNSNNTELLAADLDLWKLTNNESYLIDANRIGMAYTQDKNAIMNPGFYQVGVDDPMRVLGDWALINGSATVIHAVKAMYELRWSSFWESMAYSSDPTNYFHILKGNSSRYGEFYFWSTQFPGTSSWNVGQNSYYLCAALGALYAYNFTHEDKFLNFALTQVNWILGKNPFGVCMLEGAGSFNPPGYYNRLSSTPGNCRGAEPGIIPNGIIRPPAQGSTSSPDVPWFDLHQSTPEDTESEYQSNEPWLPHDCYFLLTANFLSQLMR